MQGNGVLGDTSALIYLAKADAFEVAHASVGAMLAPPAVWREAVEAGVKRGVSDPEVISSAQSAGWVRKVAIPSRVERAAQELARRHRIGEGESQVLAMAKRETRVVIDDLRATRVALALGLVPVPTVFLPIVGMREGGLPRQRAAEMLRRLAVVVTLSAGQLARLETLLGEPP
jgi:predicted nucleic acid-binding protein